MLETTGAPTTLRPVEAGHAHHWIIEEAHGPRSRGTCKRCGAERDFRNWLGESGDFTTQEEHRQVA
jgi:hypothetical protein